MHLLVFGGFPKKEYYRLNEGQQSKTAFLRLVDWKTGEILKELQCISPKTVSTLDTAMRFKEGSVQDGRISFPTNTEIVVVDGESLEVQNAISHKSFTDLRHVAVIDNHLDLALTVPRRGSSPASN